MRKELDKIIAHDGEVTKAFKKAVKKEIINMLLTGDMLNVIKLHPSTSFRGLGKSSSMEELSDELGILLVKPRLIRSDEKYVMLLSQFLLGGFSYKGKHVMFDEGCLHKCNDIIDILKSHNMVAVAFD